MKWKWKLKMHLFISPGHSKLALPVVLQDTATQVHFDVEVIFINGVYTVEVRVIQWKLKVEFYFTWILLDGDTDYFSIICWTRQMY